MPAADPPLPAGFGLVVDGGTRSHEDGRLLVGGHPRRLLRLTPAGAAAVADLVAGRPGSSAGRALGRRLVDAGVAHPVPPPASPGAVAEVTVVIPVRDRPRELARCLAALGGHPRVLVVDDGSSDADAVRRVAAAAGAEVLRRPRSGGPGAARNSALRHLDAGDGGPYAGDERDGDVGEVGGATTTDLVAFLDSDCVPPPGWLDALVGHLADPAVAAVAPRVRGLRRGDGTAARWAAARSPLDLGDRPARVVPGTPVSYVPTAALVVRRSALGTGFDEALRHGEDVDLVWRLHDAGWTVRFDPSVVVGHGEPERWGAFLVRRHRYGTSAGPLARRHGRRLAVVVLAPGPTATALLLLARRPRPAATVLALDAALAVRRTGTSGLPRRAAVAAVAENTARTLDGLARTATMLAGPAVLVAAAARPRTRAPLGALVLGAPLVGWARARAAGRTAGLDPVRWTLASLADDAAYGSGVWVGALRHRAAWAVLPSVVGWGRTAGAGGGGPRGRRARGVPGGGSGAAAPSRPGVPA